MTEEEYCHEMLAILRKGYERDAKPYLDRLAKIEYAKPPRPFFLTNDQMQLIESLPQSVKDELQLAPGSPGSTQRTTD